MGKCYNSTVVNTSIENLWETIRDFHQLSWGDLVISKVDIVGDISGSKAGAKRVLNEAFHETLISVDNENHNFTYSIDDGPEPVNKENIKYYVGEVKLYAITDSNQTFIEWISTFESDSDDSIEKFCNPIYAGLLKSLKSKF